MVFIKGAACLVRRPSPTLTVTAAGCLPDINW